MRKLTERGDLDLTNDSRAALDIEHLCAFLSCGKTTARRIGKAAGARVCIGGRVLYSREKVADFVRKVATE